MSKRLILAIDDAEEEVVPNIPNDEFDLIVIDPNDEELADKLSKVLKTVSLILLDQKFNAQPRPPLSLTASDGASFVAHLRSWSRIEGRALAPIVLFTNEDEAFKNEIPAVGAAAPLNGTFVGREYRLAPALDVEWVQHKGEDNTKCRIEQLARASVAALLAEGDDGASLEEIETFLRLPNGTVWANRAKEELRSARPPVDQKEERTAEQPRGPSHIIRWMCHRALPYPGMLLSDIYAAWALGISIEAFRSMAALRPDTGWLKDLTAAQYAGPLNNFLGRRWWRAGIDNLVWTLDQETSKQQSRAKAYDLLALGAQIGEMRSSSTHVVTWTPEFTECRILSMDEAVQLRPPGWPAEALDPWLAKADLENDEALEAMIEIVDLP
jgi:hypothetical protein